jgi:predicted nucleotidyltransferase
MSLPASSSQQVSEVIDEMVRRIVERFQPQKIILFGSCARGEAGPDSDVDLLVVLPVKGPKRKKLLEIRGAVMGMGLPKDILIATPEEVELYRDVAGTIIEPALRESRVLYERPA